MQPFKEIGYDEAIEIGEIQSPHGHSRFAFASLLQWDILCFINRPSLCKTLYSQRQQVRFIKAFAGINLIHKGTQRIIK